jgi:hypothetical protein
MTVEILELLGMTYLLLLLIILLHLLVFIFKLVILFLKMTELRIALLKNNWLLKQNPSLYLLLGKPRIDLLLEALCLLL